MWRMLSMAGFAAAVAVALSPTSGNAAGSEVPCGQHNDVVASFSKSYKEEPSALGITDKGGLIEVLVSPSGTWTMLLTMPGGPACILGTGEDWNMRPAPGTDRLAMN